MPKKQPRSPKCSFCSKFDALRCLLVNVARRTLIFSLLHCFLGNEAILLLVPQPNQTLQRGRKSNPTSSASSRAGFFLFSRFRLTVRSALQPSSFLFRACKKGGCPRSVQPTAARSRFFLPYCNTLFPTETCFSFVRIGSGCPETPARPPAPKQTPADAAAALRTRPAGGRRVRRRGSGARRSAT